jgi:hypothetical protein
MGGISNIPNRLENYQILCSAPQGVYVSNPFYVSTINFTSYQYITAPQSIYINIQASANGGLGSYNYTCTSIRLS